MSNLREECGLFGIFANETLDVASTTYYGLFALQHRGQENSGIVVNDDGVFASHKDIGLVQDVFTARDLQDLGKGNMAVGHVRYGTTGINTQSNSQPMVVNHHKGRMAVAHNGNLVNSYELRQELELEGSIFHSTNDTEVIAYIITKERIKSASIESAVESAMDRIEGAYSLVIMSPSKLIAVRDKHGFRPLCYGQRSDGAYIVASETCALDAVDAKYIRDLEPGEIVVFSKDGVKSITTHTNKEPHKICIFEYLYFARPDSVIEGVSVHKARMRAGACLAMEHPVQADVVIGVPDSGISAAIGYAEQSGIPYGIGFIKNKYIGRTFIAPGQENREDKVMIKLNVLKDTVEGKRVVLVDDSIVRGTTIARIINLVREAGATEIHVMSSAPPFMNPCYYGTDIDSRENLIACKMSTEEIAKAVGADSVGYLDISHLNMLLGTKPNEGYCHACFSGEYPTKEPEVTAKNRFEQKISEK
ncbi:MAG: amidophosphoribosyltransferase [Firmicutes bacterium]|nr:amidophosphoribosyltransferase [Bacillota bacterium]